MSNVDYSLQEKIRQTISDLSKMYAENEEVESLIKNAHDSDMTDPDIRRLDDKIDAMNAASLGRMEAANREWQLRFDASNAAANARMDVALARIDGRFERMEFVIGEIKTGINETKAAISSMKTVTITTGIAAVLTILFGVVGCLIGLKQVWIGGVQVGQSGRPAVASTVTPGAGTKL